MITQTIDNVYKNVYNSDMNMPPTKPRKPGRPRKASSGGNPLNQVTVHLPPELVTALDSEVSASKITSRSELIREACRNYLTQRSEQRQTQSPTRRMRDLSPQERKKAMASAAETLADYYRLDPEIRDWQALDREDFYDSGE